MVAILTRPAAVVATFCIAGLLAVKTHHTRGLLIIAGVSLIAACATELLKLIFTVTRPGESLVAIYGYSFPSTHAGTMAAFAMAAIWQSKTTYSHNKNTFIFWLGLAVFSVGFVAASRVLIGVHTVADVLAGIVIGLISARIIKAFTNPNAVGRT
jgi:membrane-associated phospholipid phosphatase